MEFTVNFGERTRTIKMTEKQIKKLMEDNMWWYNHRNSFEKKPTDDVVIERLHEDIEHLIEMAEHANTTIDEYETLHKTCLKEYGHSNWGSLLKGAKEDIVALAVVKPVFEKMLDELTK